MTRFLLTTTILVLPFVNAPRSADATVGREAAATRTTSEAKKPPNCWECNGRSGGCKRVNSGWKVCRSRDNNWCYTNRVCDP